MNGPRDLLSFTKWTATLLVYSMNLEPVEPQAERSKYHVYTL